MLLHHTWTPPAPLINVVDQCMPASESKCSFCLSKQAAQIKCSYNNIESRGQGAGKFQCNECNKLWSTVVSRSLPGLDFYTRIYYKSFLPSYVHEIAPNYTSTIGICDCVRVLSLQAVAAGYDPEEIATLIKKGTVIYYLFELFWIPVQQGKFH